MVEPIRANGSTIWIGCSGYSYKHWRGVFYPADMPTTRWLPYYAGLFPTVELNNSFYNLPSASTFAGWRSSSPEGFLFAVKANRFITHMKKLKEPEPALAKLFERAVELGDKLGPVLYQLPPRWRFNAERLQQFLAALPPGVRHTVEVREVSWLNPQFFSLLEQHGVAYCIASLPDYNSPLTVTAPFSYIRFHGSKEMYWYDYTEEELQHWRDVIIEISSQGRDVYCYFNNDPNGWAPRNALRLGDLLRQALPEQAGAYPGV